MGQQTPLYERHKTLGARIIDFGGWDMPVQYPSGILAEHAATREAIGIFDTCHMGEFRLKAPDVREALNKLCTADVRKLLPDRARYFFITAEDGTVIDDAVVFLLADDEAMICVNAGDIEGDFAFLESHLPTGASLINESTATGKIDVQGPKAWELMESVIGIDFRALGFFSFLQTTWEGVPLLLSRSGYTGEPGAELFLPAEEKTAALWDVLLEKGTGYGAIPCGLGARDTLRLESGLPLYGHEMNRQTNPIQAGFARFVCLDKPEDFPGKAALQAAASDPTELLVGLKTEARQVPREGFEILKDDAVIGRITSGGPAPTVGGNIALGYVRPDCTAEGTAVEIQIRKKRVPATICALPFYSTPLIRERIKA